MSVTHGGRKAKQFRWALARGFVIIENENGLVHRFAVPEIHQILCGLYDQFRDLWIPLANNVERMYRGNEKPGLGLAIYTARPGDTLHAQGASYLGVVLEETGVFEWNGKAKGIAWRFLSRPTSEQALCRQVKNAPIRRRRAP